MHHRLFLALVAVGILLFRPDAASADVYGAVKGTVVDDAGHPVAKASVALQAPSIEPQRATTDDGGRFSFLRVPFDTYIVSVSASGFAAQEAVITVSSAGVASLSFVLSHKQLGRVVTRASASEPNSVSVISQSMLATLPNNGSLNKVIETLPGIVPFSYDEPVARGFHGLLYQVDGVPLPQTTSAHFPDVVDPSYVDRLEVFTGAVPAEFGGEREGAVVSIITKRAGDITGGGNGRLTLSAGTYGSAGMDLSESAGGGPLRVFFSLAENRTNRGLDSPTFVPEHDQASHGSEFVRAIYSPTPRDTFSFDFSNQYAGYKIPIDTNFSDPTDPFPALPGTDDSQHEYDRFVNLAYNRLSADGKGYFELAPYFRSDRVTFLPDPAKDLDPSLLAVNPQPTSAFQDRTGKYYGLSASLFRSAGKHNWKVGVQGNTETFAGAFTVRALSYVDRTSPALGTMLTSFSDDVTQHGSNLGVYLQDKVDASAAVTLNLGLRYDRSTGFVDGNQLSPRLEVNVQPNERDTLHVYFGRLYAAPALEDTRREVLGLSGASGSSLPAYDLKPERDSVFEVGLAHQLSPLARVWATFFTRNVANVLDTTQLGSSPIFTVFNSAVGRAEGIEMHVEGRNPHGDGYFVSYTLSQSLAEGISGGTFLFPPDALAGANSLAPEDHDQTNTLNAGYTWALGADHQKYAGLQTMFGSGYPVQFENGPGRLPVHWELDASFGRRAPADGRGLGYEISGTNLLDHKYLIKIANGFNTTQYAAGRQITAKLIVPLPK